MKNVVLILTGGGARGAFQIGAWNRILDEGINFGNGKEKIGVPKAIFGVSAGALNGAMIAMEKNDEIIQLWNDIAGNPNEIFTSDYLKTVNNKTTLDIQAFAKYILSDLGTFQKIGLLFEKSRNKTLAKVIDKIKSIKGIADNTPLLQKVNELIKVEDIKSEVFQAGFVSLTDGKYYSIKHTDFASNEALQNAVLASSTIPIVWSPVERVSTHKFELSNLIDGGIRNVTPLGDAIKYVENSNDDDFYFLIISCHTNGLKTMEEPPNILNIIERSIFDIAMNEIRNSDVSEFLRINDLVKQATQKGIELLDKNGRKLKSFKVKIIEPERELSTGLDFSRTAAMDSFTHGYSVAKSVIDSPDWD